MEKAFSLIELLVVVSIIVLMMSLLMPAISGMTSTAGRRGAVNVLMNTFEQARVAALESGRTVYVIFWRRSYPEKDAIAVFRDPEVDGEKYEQLTPWRKLPKGVLLHQPGKGESMLSSKLTLADAFDSARMANPPPIASGDEPLKGVAFNSSGAVSYPVDDKKYLKLIVSEGVRGQGGTEALISERKQDAGGFEIISFSRYTGRAQLDVTTLKNE